MFHNFLIKSLYKMVTCLKKETAESFVVSCSQIMHKAWITITHYKGDGEAEEHNGRAICMQ